MLTWIQAIQSKPAFKQKLSDAFGVVGAGLYLLAIFIFMPVLVLVGLAMIGVNVDWFNPLTWLGAFLLTLIME